MKYYGAEQIHYMDAGIVTMGNDKLRNLLAQVLTRVPIGVVDDVFENCVYLTLEPKQQGMFIPNRVLKNKHIILCSHELFNSPEDEQIKVILHETAHYVLHHKSPLEWDPANVKSFELEYDKQEQQTWTLVNKWLAEWLKHQSQVDS